MNPLNLALAFTEGLALILSPCILPILPIVLSGSLTGGVKRPFGIVAGFVLFFAVFTLFSRTIVEHVGVNLDLIRQISFILIIFFGIVLASDYLSDKFSRLTSSVANLGQNLTGKSPSDGFFSGVYLGIFISLIWVPCGGPILAAAIIQTAVQQTPLAAFLSFLFFALGSAVPMLIIALAGRKILAHLAFLKNRSHFLRKLFGLIMIIAASLAAIIGTSAAYQPIPATPNVVLHKDAKGDNKLIDELVNPYTAPLLDTNATWINSEPLTFASLKGKVVLVDFWTYSCINCIRTLPYLQNWYNKYHKDGLVIIGVHAPEFEFEKSLDNVKAAVAKYGITYPVVLDNNYVTWQHFHNQYWPAHYLIDKNGLVVYQHFGEGDYEGTEYNIRSLLGLNAEKTTNNPEASNNNLSEETPETYLGYERADTFYNDGRLIRDKVATYKFPAQLSEDHWTLQGPWLVTGESIISQENNTSVKINFSAKKVFVVTGRSGDNPVKVQVKLDGKPIGNKGGKDVKNSELVISDHRLYEVVNLEKHGKGVLELTAEGQGLEIYTFTFGE